MADATIPAPNDPELDRLAVELLKTEARAKLTTAATVALGSLSPGLTDTPKGEVTLGAKAGALAPWLTYQVLADAAEQIAHGVRRVRDTTSWRVLVTTDANLLDTDVRGQLIRNALTARTREIDPLPQALRVAAKALEGAVKTYTSEEAPPPHRFEERHIDDGELRDLGDETGGPGLVAASVAEAVEEEDQPGEEPRAGAEQPGEEGGEGEAEPEVTEPLAVAGELVRLVATDFTMSSAEVSADAALLALLTAGALGPWAEQGPETAHDIAEAAATKAAEAAVDAINAALKGKANAAAVSSAAQDAANQAVETARTAAAHAAAAAGQGIEVLLDGFDVSYGNRPTFRALDDLAKKADELSVAALKLRAYLTPVAAELADRKTAADAAQGEWTKAAANKDVTDARLAEFKERRDQLIAEVSRRQAAVGPAQAVLDQAVAALGAARSDLTAVTMSDASGVSPVGRACAREAMHLKDAQGRITHVLYVRPTHAGADVVTRRSVLGSSGRVSYLGGANTAWALLEVEHGKLVGGGSTEQARQLTHDLTTGKTTTVTAVTQNAVDSLGEDPLAKYEKNIRTAVLFLAAGVALLGIAAVLAVVIGPIVALLN